MKQDADIIQLNTRQIELHLKSAVDTLTPNILERLDLSVPQDPVPKQQDLTTILRLQRRMRGMGIAAAACISLILMGSGAFHYHLENWKVESVIGIDVNPSIELSINRRERVLEARALNTEAANIIQDMALEGVDLNVAVNAVVGSMVTHGYLDDLENAILVTVSNDSVRKAQKLRASVVGDIEQTLKENQVEAVVYDQQVIEDEEMEALARQYDISYGKAYFLKELIDQNEGLDIDDMEKLADRVKETETAPQTTEAVEPETSSTEAISTEESSTEPETTEEPTTEAETTTVPETTREPVTEPETEEEEPVEIDYVDFEDDMVYVYFMDRIHWKNPSVVVRDEEGNSYAAMIDETSRNECSFEVSGLEGGRGYVFVLGGLTAGDSDLATTVKGYFEKPEVADGADNEFMDESEETESEKDETTVTGDEDPGEIESVTEDTEESMTQSISEEESDTHISVEEQEESSSEAERTEEILE